MGSCLPCVAAERHDVFQTRVLSSDRLSSALVRMSNISLLLSLLVLGQRLVSRPVKALELLLDTSSVPLCDSESPVQEYSGKDVEHNICPEDAKVAPYLTVVDVAAGKELVGVAERAVLTVSSGGGILKGAGCGGEVSSHILATSLTGRWIENAGFSRIAHNWFSVQLRSNNTTNPVRKWRHAIHEDPETRKCVRCLHDTVEDQGHGKQECDNSGGSLSVRHGDDTEMCECAGVDEELNEEEQDQSLLQRSLNTLDSVVVRAKDEDSQDDVVRNFNHDVGQDEGFPRVGFAGTFSDFVQRALVDEERHDLEEVSVQSSEAKLGRFHIPVGPKKRRLCKP